MCPTDLAQGLHVLLTDGVCLSRHAALRALLSPPALWEHMYSAGAHKIKHTHSELHVGWLTGNILRRGETDACNTPVFLQGGEVGEQALMVEFLQL